MPKMLSREITPENGLGGRARSLFHAAALAAAMLSTACTFTAVAHAETEGALPPGYTNDAPAQDAPPAAVQVQQVSDVNAGDEYADTDPSALTDFREPLAPYGVWVEDPSYGIVWVPSGTVVGADFAPYQTSGHWALDDNDDWVWVSDYDWGYIPFHYGRWVWIAGTGWAWIPGRVYAPAWVTWRIGDGGYIGWAPMPPTWYWYGGVATGLWVTPYAAFCFVPTTYVFHEHVYTYVVHDAAVVRTAAATTRPYKPATPHVGGGSPAHPEGARAHGGFRTASPRLSEASIPSSSAPKARVAPDARAQAFATRSSMQAMRHPGIAAPSHRGVAGNSPWQTHAPSFDRGARAPALDRGDQAAALDRSARAPALDRGRAPSFDRSPGGPVLRTPGHDLPNAGRPAPGFSPPAPRPSPGGSPSFRPSSPSFRPPSPAIRPSAPAAPSRPSTPAARPSAPAAPAHGGGRHR